jgi:hypothetical protein
MLWIAALPVLIYISGCSRPSSPPSASAPVTKQEPSKQDVDVLPIARICSTPTPKGLDAAVSHVENIHPSMVTGLVVVGSPAELRNTQVKIDKASEAILRGYIWRDDAGKVRHSLRVTFLGGDPEVQQRIKNVVQLWSKVINMKFEFVDSGETDIRIGISDNGYSWSRVGNDAANYKDHETMHYGWLDRATSEAEYMRTVLHEFGHALGAVHEHQNPEGEIKWNTQVVYAWCASNNPPWSTDDCDVNILNHYKPDEALFTRLDPSSIMVYSFPSSWTTDGTSMPSNWRISNDDKALMATIYGAPVQ